MIEEADAEMRALAAGLRDEYPGIIESESIAAASAIALRDSLVGGAAITLWLLLGAVR